MKSYIPYLVVLLLISVAAAALVSMEVTEIVEEPGVSLALPDTLGSWSGESLLFCQSDTCMYSFSAPQSKESPVCPRCGSEVRSSWSVAEVRLLPSDTVLLKKAYSNQRGQTLYASVVVSGRERVSIHRPQMCLAGQGYTITRQGTQVLDVPGREPLIITVLDLQPPLRHHALGQKRFFAYWFVGAERETASHWARTWYTALDRLLLNRAHRWSYISVMGNAQTDGPVLNDATSDFIALLCSTITHSDPGSDN